MVPEGIGTFRRSAHSGAEGNCVEVAVTTTGGRAIRDSKNSEGPLLYLAHYLLRRARFGFVAIGAGMTLCPCP
ncbi:DUF397 domain-containing protein [Streptomyces sp. 11x1]|uniref:DUF397 domain-containing protein n=1 Tax=Streptomyces sp. 11x1 TaxID=3038642 RepID=UPI00292FEB54|nr:DUF397 domain-containing protein [Streptomyces sp. 11x1]WNZ14510.1 DUF397 domain-containing protein [Streptomyces sp. 11x1]